VTGTSYHPERLRDGPGTGRSVSPVAARSHRHTANTRQSGAGTLPATLRNQSTSGAGRTLPGRHVLISWPARPWSSCWPSAASVALMSAVRAGSRRPARYCRPVAGPARPADDDRTCTRIPYLRAKRPLTCHRVCRRCGRPPRQGGSHRRAYAPADYALSRKVLTVQVMTSQNGRF